MGETLSPVEFIYFGKIAARGDFVRSPSHAPLIKLMDRWLSQGLDLLAQDAHWKSHYDQAGPLHFAFLGVHSRHALAGHIVPSADLSGRRFPWVMAATFHVEAAANFVGRAPMALQRLWGELAIASRRIREADDPHPMLAEYSDWRSTVSSAHHAHDGEFLDFVTTQTVGSLQGLLTAAGHTLDLRLSLLALGLLLEAVPTRGRQPIEKGLSLPLPVDPLLQGCVASFWLDLVSRFIKNRADLELAVYLPQTPREHAPSMFLGFSGGAPAQFSAMLDLRGVHESFVDIRRAGWAEAHAQQAFSMRKLSNYLRQPQLSLQQAVRTFYEAFLGE